MRTTETALDATLAGTPAGLRLADMGAKVTTAFATVWRLLKNRRASARLHDLDDRQLADIGLIRSDLHDAATFAYSEDVARYLTQVSRMRADAYYRDVRKR
jgi:uncharacterized protein YjiS (DUF1127 family)